MKLTEFTEYDSTSINYIDTQEIYIYMDCGFSFSELELKKLLIFFSYSYVPLEEFVGLIKRELKKTLKILKQLSN